MKARIPLTGKMKRDAYAEIRAQVVAETQKQSADQMRRFFKLAGVVLIKDCARAYQLVTGWRKVY